MPDPAATSDPAAPPVTLVTTGGGGSYDHAARFLAPALARALEQPVGIAYHAQSGAGQHRAILDAPPDGRTILGAGRTHWLIPMLRPEARYDVLRDLAPISQTTRGAEVLVVRPDLPATTIADVVALARRDPGGLSYASNADGGNPHLAAELLKMMAGIDIRRVRCRNSAERFARLQVGEVDMYFTGVCSFAGQIRSGALKAIGVTTATRSPIFPELPTIAESGVPGYENITLGALFAHAATPPPVLRRLERAAVAAMRSPDARDYFLCDGYEPVGGGSEALRDLIVADVERVRALLRALGIGTSSFG